MSNYNNLLKLIKDNEIKKLKDEYEKSLNLIENKSYTSLGHLLNSNKELLKQYSEFNEEYIKYYVEKNTNYDDRYFYLNSEKISMDYFFEKIKDKNFEMNLSLKSYTQQIFINLDKDKLEIYYYCGD